MTTIRLFRPRVVNPLVNPVVTWSDVMDRFFENDNRLDYGYSSPKTNILETEDSYKIEMLVPGVSKSDVKIELENDVLTISKSVKQDEEENTTYRLREFVNGTFERRFSMPDNVNAENIKADYNNGILTLTIAKKEEAKPVKRAISIE